MDRTNRRASGHRTTKFPVIRLLVAGLSDQFEFEQSFRLTVDFFADPLLLFRRSCTGLLSKPAKHFGWLFSFGLFTKISQQSAVLSGVSQKVLEYGAAEMLRT